jgi:hypothetical protein
MCRIASLFLLQRVKGSMSGDARDFNNVETRAVTNLSFFLQGKIRKRKNKKETNNKEQTNHQNKGKRQKGVKKLKR